MYVVKLGIWKSILCQMGIVGWDMLALGQSGMERLEAGRGCKIEVSTGYKKEFSRGHKVLV